MAHTPNILLGCLLWPFVASEPPSFQPWGGLSMKHKFLAPNSAVDQRLPKFRVTNTFRGHSFNISTTLDPHWRITHWMEKVAQIRLPQTWNTSCEQPLFPSVRHYAGPKYHAWTTKKPSPVSMMNTSPWILFLRRGLVIRSIDCWWEECIHQLEHRVPLHLECTSAESV